MGSPKSQHIEMVYDTELAVMNATGIRWGKKFCWEVDDSRPGVAAAGGMDKFWKGMQKKSKFKALTGPAAGNCTGGTNPKQACRRNLADGINEAARFRPGASSGYDMTLFFYDLHVYTNLRWDVRSYVRSYNLCKRC